MIYGLDGAPVPATLKDTTGRILPYVSNVNSAADSASFSPALLMAVAIRETIREFWDASASQVSGDGGYGLCQLTDPWRGTRWPPPQWDDPTQNCEYAVEHYLREALAYWAGAGFRAYDLAKLTAATFNEGLGNAIAAHAAGNVDKFDTDGYGAYVANCYEMIVLGEPVIL